MPTATQEKIDKIELIQMKAFMKRKLKQWEISAKDTQIRQYQSQKRHDVSTTPQQVPERTFEEVVIIQPEE